MDARKKPYIVAVIIQLIYTGMFVVSKASFNQGMSTYVFIFYRQAAGSILLLPLAILHQRKNARPAPPLALLLKLFVCALIGVLGGILLVGGLYGVLWGKSNEKGEEEAEDIGSTTPRGEMDTDKTDDAAACVSVTIKTDL